MTEKKINYKGEETELSFHLVDGQVKEIYLMTILDEKVIINGINHDAERRVEILISKEKVEISVPKTLHEIKVIISSKYAKELHSISEILEKVTENDLLDINKVENIVTELLDESSLLLDFKLDSLLNIIKVKLKLEKFKINMGN